MADPFFLWTPKGAQTSLGAGASLLVTSHSDRQLDSIAQARLQLSCFPIPPHEVDQAIHEFFQARPTAKGQDLVNQLAEAILKQWCSGIGCC